MRETPWLLSNPTLARKIEHLRIGTRREVTDGHSAVERAARYAIDQGRAAALDRRDVLGSGRAPEPIRARQNQRKQRTWPPLREKLGLTQAQLARLTREVQPTISDRERGRIMMTRLALMALLYLETLPRAELDALLADPPTLENEG